MYSPVPVNNGGPAPGEHGAGAEYTLQGVMRFIHVEWHAHERARNAWEIERAEMKQKITRMEGENNHLKRSHQVLEKHIKMLEKVILDERAKHKAAMAGDKPPSDDKAEVDFKAKAALKLELQKAKAHYNSILDMDSDPKDPETSAEVDKSRRYLTKCVEEITYLLIPPAHPPPPPMQSMGNSRSYMDQQESQMTMEEVFQQHRQRTQQHNTSGHAPQHQAPTVPSSDSIQQSQGSHLPQQAEFMSRESSTQPLFSPSNSLLSAAAYSGNEVLSPAPDGYRSIADESSAEKFLEQYRLYGHQYSSRQDDARHRQPIQDGRDAFMFGDAPVIPDDNPSAQTSRPDKDQFPEMAVRRQPGAYIAPHRRKSSGSNVTDRRRSQEPDTRDITVQGLKQDPGEFKLRFALNGHLDVVRSVIFTGGGSPSEPEICSAGDDGMIKRWIIPASYVNVGPHGPSDLDINSYFTHRGHEGTVTCLAAAPVTASFSTGGRASGDGWIFSGGQDATVRVWERGRVDPKATLHGHLDAVWSLCVLPGTCGSVFGPDCNNIGPPDRILLASGSADGSVKIWAVSAPPHLSSPQAGSRRGVGGSRRHSVTSGSNYPSSPQPTTASQTAFRYSCVHTITRPDLPSPTCISPLSPGGENFVVSYNDSTIAIFDTRTAEEIICMASQETYNGTPSTGINAVVATALGLESNDIGRGMLDDENVVHGATGSMGLGGVEGVVISGHEDQFIRFFDANSGQCTYSMLAHPSAISALSLSKDGREVVSAGHDASIRFWSLEKRMCTQEMTSHRVMFGEGVCSVVWSQDGRFVVSGGGDSSVKVFTR